MDSGVIFILSMIPFAVTGIAFARMFEKKKRKEEEADELFLKKHSMMKGNISESV